VISVVCVYNDREVVEAYLLKGVKAQTANCDIILVDNTDKHFKAAAQALNYGGRRARGNYIMFVHQDVILKSNSFLHLIETTLEQLPSLGVAGAAGCTEGLVGTLSNISHGTPPTPAGTGGTVAIPTRVQTLDECLIIVPRGIFDRLQFDERTCDGWHLYAVDYSLSVKTLGLNAYVVPVNAYHRGGSRMQRDYYEILKKVLKKHRDRYRVIFTTCGVWDTRIPVFLQRFDKWARSKVWAVVLLLRAVKHQAQLTRGPCREHQSA